MAKPNGDVIHNSYFPNGGLQTQTDGRGKTTSYAQNALGQVVAATDPNNRTTSVVLNARGLVTSQTDAGGGVITSTFDNSGAVTSRTFSWDTQNNATFTYNRAGARQSISDKSGTTNYSYDSLGRLTQETNGAGKTVKTAYDLSGQITAITYPNNQSVNYAIGDDGEVTAITDWHGNTSSFTFDENASLSQSNYANGMKRTASYNPAGLRSRVSYVDANNWKLAKYETGFDATGAVVGRSTAGNIASMSPNESYTYDANSRLTKINHAVAYAYDPSDNPTTLLGGIGQTFDSANQLVSSTTRGGTTYDYDDNGNRRLTTLAGGQETEYSYTEASQLQWVQTNTPHYASEVAADNPVAHFRLKERTDTNIWDEAVQRKGYGSGYWVSRASGALTGDDHNGAIAFANDTGQLWFDDTGANTNADGKTTVEFLMNWDDNNVHPEIVYAFDDDYGLTLANNAFGFSTSTTVHRSPQTDPLRMRDLVQIKGSRHEKETTHP